MFESAIYIIKFFLVWLVGFFLYSRYAYKPWRLSYDFVKLLYWLYDYVLLLYSKIKQKIKRK